MELLHYRTSVRLFLQQVPRQLLQQQARPGETVTENTPVKETTVKANEKETTGEIAVWIWIPEHSCFLNLKHTSRKKQPIGYGITE